MQKPPKVSIIIPVYNDEAHVSHAIESALSQTMKEVEVIVVDDGSTDGTPEVLRRYDGRIKAIRQENQGPAAAMNAALRHSSGQYVSFIESDDWVSAEKSEALSRYLDEHPDVGLCYGRWQTVSEVTREVLSTQGAELPADPTERLAFAAPFPPVAVQMRREWLDRVGWFDDDLRTLQDIDLWCRLHTAGCKFARATKQLVAFYLVRESSLSRNPELMHRHFLLVLDKYFRLLGSKAPKALESRAKGTIWARLGAFRIRSRSANEARNAWQTARGLWPDVFGDIPTWIRILSYMNPLFPYRHPEGLPDYEKTWEEVGSLLREIVENEKPERKGPSRELGSFAYALSRLAFSRAKGWRARKWLVRSLLIRPSLFLEHSVIRQTAKTVLGPSATKAVQKLWGQSRHRGIS